MLKEKSQRQKAIYYIIAYTNAIKTNLNYNDRRPEQVREFMWAWLEGANGDFENNGYSLCFCWSGD